MTTEGADLGRVPVLDTDYLLRVHPPNDVPVVDTERWRDQDGAPSREPFDRVVIAVVDATGYLIEAGYRGRLPVRAP